MRGKSLEIYQHLSLRAVEQAYQEASAECQHFKRYPTMPETTIL
jgi:hypothetical protein